MNSPRRPDGPAIYDGKSYSAAVHLAEDVKPFVAIANGLRERGFSAPAIRHADLDAGFLITEDFGSAGVIEGDPPRPIAERYEAATDMLAALHREAAARNPAAGAAAQLRHSRRSISTHAGRDRTDARMVSAGPRRRAEPSNCAPNSSRCGASCWTKPAAAPRDLGDAGFSFAQPDLARRARRHRARRHHRLPGCRAGPGRLRSGVAAAGCADRRSRAARARAADPLHQGAARGRRRFRSGRLRRALRHHVGAAQHAAARHLCPAQPARRQAAISAPPAPDLDLSQPLAGPPGAGGVSRMVCRQRRRRRFRDLPLVSHPASNLRPAAAADAQDAARFEAGRRPWHGGRTAQGRTRHIRARHSPRT